MYLRDVHKDLDLPSLHNFIRENPLGVLTTALKSPSYPLLQNSHIPWVLDVPPTSDDAPKAILRGHLARANPQTKAILAAAEQQRSDKNVESITLEEEVLLLFTSPIAHYITPQFYTETKPTTGKTVPTWNYAAVQAYGSLTVHYGDEFLGKQIDDLTRECEEGVMGYKREESWTVDDAPERYVGVLKKAILGVEVRVQRLEGKWKMSQELGEGDRRGVVGGLEGIGSLVGREVAGLVRERGKKKCPV